MEQDGDLSAALPPPPTPRRARREETIATALRRFEGLDPAPPARAPRARGRFTALGRSQAAAFAAVLLVALIGVPAWILGEHPFADAPPAVHAPPRPDTMSASRDTGVAPVHPAAPVPAIRPPLALIAPAAQSGTAPPSEAPQFAAPSSPPAAISRSASASAADMPQAAPPAPPPPPPPPPAPVVAAEPILPASPPADVPGREEIVVTGARVARSKSSDADSTGDIVVSAQRRPRATSASRRGDWNACTVDDPKRSVAKCRAALGRDPDLAQGVTLAWQGDLSAAIPAFDRALAAAPGSAAGHLNRGLAYARLGEFDRARADLDAAVRAEPGAARGYYHRALLERRRGDDAAAAADSARAIALDDRYAAALR